MHLDFLLETTSLTAIRFSESSATSTPRPVTVIEIDKAGERVKVVCQGLFKVELKWLTVDEFIKTTWLNIQSTRAEAAKDTAMAARTWLPCSPDCLDVLGKLITKGPIVAKRQEKKAVAAPAKAKPTESALPRAVADAFRRSAIELSRADGLVAYIPMSEGFAFDIEKMGTERFDDRYKPIVDYPIDRAAKLYVSYACVSGGSQAAMKALGGIINVSTKEFDMATKKAASAAATAPAKKAAGKAAPAKKTTGKAVVAPEEKTSKPRGDSAAAMFQALIREQKLTDDAIFTKVQAKFGLADNKRGYVAWYRNYLGKKGEVYEAVTK